MEAHQHKSLLLISFFFPLIITIFNFPLALCHDVPSPSPQPNSALVPPTESPASLETEKRPDSLFDKLNNIHDTITGKNDKNVENCPLELKKICDKTDHPALCIAVIAPAIHAKEKIDVPNVLDVAIKASTEITKAAISIAKKVASLPVTRPDVASILEDCKGSYSDALDNFQKAMDALPERDIGTVNTMLSAVITDVGDCEDAFAGDNSGSPLAAYAEKVTDMTANCLGISSLLEHQ